ncbi:MAG: hypothetical protein PVG33_10130 [Chloroflexota bacterium]
MTHSVMSHHRVVFACAAAGAPSLARACLLAESIRRHAGRFANEPIWLFQPQGANGLSADALGALDRLGVRSMAFEVGPGWQSTPFAGKVAAAAAAEALAAGRGQLLVWLDPDTIFFQEPGGLLLQPGKVLGCRPVDHKLIGSAVDKPPDPFWQDIYQLCGVPQARLFTMTTSADAIRIRPYINAGCLVVRPETGLLQAWRQRFDQALASGAFEAYFQRNVLYRIFLHQAILAGAVLSILGEEQIQILPHLVNYPMHMHGQYPADRRPARMNDLISGRYDTFFDDPEWPALFPSDEPLQGWLARRLTHYNLAAGQKA